MQTRLIIAYVLIGVLVAAAALLVRLIIHKRREHRRLMRGRGSYTRHSARKWPSG